MMKMFAVCAAVVALLAIQCHATANIASATSSSTAVVNDDFAFVYSDDTTYVKGDGLAYADGYAVAVTPTCLVVADTAAVSIVAEHCGVIIADTFADAFAVGQFPFAHCGVIIADTFADAFAVGQFPFAVVNTWAVANDIDCTAFALLG
eukprot:TRINITY_DN240_c0_g1_i10.p2 TRINITY_DN240_c0_g1~~TRINITY_DN240_c0_g1_i10.p2  ORF type:complete len:149 (-),score=26.68 TRINITY_DN240_c0_g1_i10:261-707(-)